MTISNSSGSIDFGPCCPANDADGIASAGNGPFNSWDGIAGMEISRGRFLAAVFLDDSEPSDPSPDRLVITDTGFSSLVPGLRQSFFVGDGLTGNGAGSVQEFQVPDGATRVMFGVHDSGPPDSTVPGWYGDNSGSIAASVEITAGTPVPALGAFARAGLVIATVLTGALYVLRSRIRVVT